MPGHLLQIVFVLLVLAASANSLNPFTLVHSNSARQTPKHEASYTYYDISFDCNLYLHNVTGSGLLGSSDQSAIVASVVQTLDLYDDQVTFLAQQIVEIETRRQLTAGNHYGMIVTLAVKSSTDDFSDDADQDPDTLYNRLSTTLSSQAIHGDLTAILRSVSVEQSADSTMYVGDIDATTFNYESQMVYVSGGKSPRSKFSALAIAFVITGAVFGVFMLWWLRVFMEYKARKDGTTSPTLATYSSELAERSQA